VRLKDFKPWSQGLICVIPALAAFEVWLIAAAIPGSGQWLYDWQTLLAGLLAFIGALWAVVYLYEQIRQTERTEIVRRTREENAIKGDIALIA